MKLASLLTTDQILLEMRSTGHWEAVVELMDHLVAIGRLDGGEARDEVLAALRAREEQVSTGVGSGVAIPHTRSGRVDEVAAVFGRSSGGIDFEAIDNAPVHFVVLFIVPEQHYALHLQTLAAIAKTFAHRGIRSALAAAQSRVEILAVLAGEAPQDPLPPGAAPDPSPPA